MPQGWASTAGVAYLMPQGWASTAGVAYLMPQGWASTAGAGSASVRKTAREKFIMATAISTSSNRISPNALAILHSCWLSVVLH